jgi:hypothetical protein
VATLLVALGALFYWIMGQFRRLYGAAEAVVGVAGCWASLGKTDLPLAATVGAVGSVYLIVRCLDNFFEGHKAARREKDGAASG